MNVNAALIIGSPLAGFSASGYYQRWIAVANSFSRSYKESADLNKALKHEPFIYAAYGYAVEALTNDGVGKLKSTLPHGYTLTTQATRGHTRPDIVIKNGAGEDVGWFDLTASDSETHIDKKTGSGWGTRDYVAEVTYPSLVTSTLKTICDNALAGSIDKEELKRLNEMSQQNEAMRKKQYDKTAGFVRLAIKTVKDQTNMTKRRSMFEEALGALMTDDNGTKLEPKTAKGILGDLWPHMDDYNSYAKIANAAGYKGANAGGGSAEPARELIYGLSVDNK